ncbi:hypothetical protein J6590_061157 [Homalodisca vitripennis]|nr:hypothetical protein J6590_061157 [Homalodisca vitripennis]
MISDYGLKYIYFVFLLVQPHITASTGAIPPSLKTHFRLITYKEGTNWRGVGGSFTWGGKNIEDSVVASQLLAPSFVSFRSKEYLRAYVQKFSLHSNRPSYMEGESVSKPRERLSQDVVSLLRLCRTPISKLMSLRNNRKQKVRQSAYNGKLT